MTDNSGVLLGQILTVLVLVFLIAAIIGSTIAIRKIVQRRKQLRRR